MASRSLSSLLISGVATAALLSASSAAQVCDNPADNFWQNDNLPQVPAGSLTVSIIQGLCEGEALAQVFYLPGGSPKQKLNKVSVGFGQVSGAGGFNATANVEIYDGISWSGGIPTLGPKVFDLNDDTAADAQVFSHGINEVDLSGFNVEVGDGTNAFVVAFRSNINPNGSCAGGHPANYFTDVSGGGGCQTVPQTSLIDLQGQGWRDAGTATVSGFPLCPLFFNGNWVIRACSEDVGGIGQFVDVGNNLTGFFAPSLTGTGSLAANGAFSLSFTGMPISTSGFFFFDLSSIFAPFKGGVLVPGVTFQINFPTPPQVFASVDFPAVMPPGLPTGTSIWAQGWFPDAGGPAGASATNGLQLITP
ncbi:MAG: hypothetical protein ACI9EF_001588 [Pseudohongiellaceae bacterium]|jgi:hypothetical protein